MIILTGLAVALGVASVAVAQRAPAQASRSDGVRSDTSFATAPWVWRNIGPARIGGHVTDIAVPFARGRDEARAGAVMYVAGPGGLFKTTDGGGRWRPLLDGETTQSVFAVSVAPSDPNIVWVATGNPHVGHDPHPGVGILKSTDAGEHWTPAGFERSEYIGRLVVHPADPNTVYAGVIGSLTRASSERGVYRTTDGGASWSRVLFVNEWTGVIDLAMDPSNPRTLYAVAWQQAATPRAFIDFGEGSGFFKSTDGGTTWRKLTDGLPRIAMGRGAIAVSHSSPNVVYAIAEAVGPSRVARDTADNRIFLYRSVDGGEHWVRGAATRILQNYAADFGRVWVDPTDAARVYVSSVRLDQFADSGKTLLNTGVSVPLADSHALWINPANPAHHVMGNDHGIYISENRGATWSHVESLNMARAWSLSADTREFFYRVYATLQDSYGLGGPSRSRNTFGIPSSEWISPPFAEIAPSVADPKDTNTVYGSGGGFFGGGLVRFDLRTHETTVLGPFIALGEHERARDIRRSSAIVSSHDHRVVYATTTRVWKSVDRGEHWLPISDEFVPTAATDSVQIMGRWFREGQRLYFPWGVIGSVIVAMSESPLDPKVLWAGTHDGTLMVTRDGGRSWQRAAPRPDTPTGVPVSSIVASRVAAGVAYASTRARDASDPRPHVFKTTDFGAHWSRISSNLPEGAVVWSLAEHFRARGLLFAGTDDGVFVTPDDGKHWAQLRGNLPRALRVRDLLVQQAANDLVISAWGRGLWILDDITPLEHWSSAVRSASPYLFPIRRAVRYRTRGWTHFEEPQYSAPNPPYGALITYYVPDAARGVRDTIDIVDSRGAIIRAFVADSATGFHRFAWDLRGGATVERGPLGAYAQPGEYEVRFRGQRLDARAVQSEGRSRRLTVVRDPLFLLPRAIEDEIAASATRAARLDTEIFVTASTARDLIRQLDSTRTLLGERSATTQQARALALRDSANAILEPVGRPVVSEREADTKPPAADQAVREVRSQLDGQNQSGVTAPLLDSQRRLLDRAAAVSRTQRERLRVFLTRVVAAYEADVRAAGVAPMVGTAKLLAGLLALPAPVVTAARDYTEPIVDAWSKP